ncbi:M15 family metallopeptidase, partial [Candidatus Saccharibacteria bacterium]|nr:M15 family metallopeptidase [Candidatus Saccharibacteria bacterium]
QQLIDTTLKPIDDNSGNYYDCIIKGEASCTNLGLGSQNAPSNSPDEAKLSGFGFIGGFLNNLISRRNEVATNKLDDKVNKGNLGQFTQSISDDITPRASEYENKDTLDAAIRTGSSETILQSIGKSDTEVDTPDPEALLELGQRFVRATTNGNFARVNYDRQSKQSVALGSTYFTAGGQLLNNDMGLLESWSLTKNLSVLEESPAFRAAVIGSPIGVFAQDGNNDGYEECQKTYDDDAPIGKVDTNIDRPVQRSSCFRRALIPNENEFAQDRSLKRVYKLLEQNNNEYDNSVSSSGGLGGVIGRIIKSANAEKLGAYRNKSIRTSPIAVEKVNLSSDLGPEFDAYINQVYGVAKTGAEVNGDAYDTMAMAAQAIWTQAALDKDYGIGGKYLDSVETAEISRYARVMKKEKLALTPLSERLLSITTPDSLAGKLALLTPTNKIDGAKKTLALYKTENLSGAIAAHLTPTTLAEAADPVNIFNGVPGGYPLSDPSNTMNAGQLWDTYDCDNGGVNQEVSQPNGIPFDVATTTNPCRRESVVTMVAGCYLDSQASCNLEELNAPETTGVEIDDRGADTSNTPCAAGSTAERLATLQNGAQIKLCDYGAVTGINASWSSDVAAMLQAASGQIELSGNAYRDSANQIELRKKHCGSSQYDIYQKPSGSCRPPTAIPGRSNHEYGLAIDFKNCSNRGTACYQWLAANAGTYNIKNFPKEAWHWSFNGS